jgi:hypothetical protein
LLGRFEGRAGEILGTAGDQGGTKMPRVTSLLSGFNLRFVPENRPLARSLNWNLASSTGLRSATRDLDNLSLAAKIVNGFSLRNR